MNGRLHNSIKPSQGVGRMIRMDFFLSQEWFSPRPIITSTNMQRIARHSCPDWRED